MSARSASAHVSVGRLLLRAATAGPRRGRRRPTSMPRRCELDRQPARAAAGVEHRPRGGSDSTKSASPCESGTAEPRLVLVEVDLPTATASTAATPGLRRRSCSQQLRAASGSGRSRRRDGRRTGRAGSGAARRRGRRRCPSSPSRRRRRSARGRCRRTVCERVVEDRRVRLGHADDVAVDDHPHAACARPSPTWHTPLRREHLLDLPARVRDHADRHAARRAARAAPPCSPGSASATGTRCACRPSACRGGDLIVRAARRPTST